MASQVENEATGWAAARTRCGRRSARGCAAARTRCGRRSARGCAAARELSEKLESPLDEVLVELEHPAVPGVGIDDELAVRESSIEVDGVLGGHHLVAFTVHDEHRLVDAREVGRLLLTPSVDGLQLGAERANGDGLVAVARTFLQPCQELLARLGARSQSW